MSLPARGIVAAPIAAHGRPIEDVLDAAAHGLLHLSARLAELERGFPVCIGGFHVSGCISMLPNMPPEMVEAQALGISLFAGEAEERRLDPVLRDAWNSQLAPLYNHMKDLPALAGEPPPILPRKHVRRTAGSLSSIDLGRGCPYQCSFCTIINVQGRKSRFRSADDLERLVREKSRPRHQALLHHRRQFCPQPRLGENWSTA